MKKLLFLFAICLSPLFTYANGFLNGVWVNDFQKTRITIEKDRHGLDVYGLRPRGHVSFDRVSQNKYRSRCGNFTIKVREHNRIKLYERSRHHSQGTTFKKLIYSSYSTGCSIPSGNYGHHGYHSGNRHHKGNRGSSNRGFADSHRGNSFGYEGSLGAHLEGTWFSDQTGDKVIILNDRGDIKVKIRGQERWFRFTKISDSTFRDEKGNTYRYRDNGDLVWTDRDGLRSFRLSKDSDAIQW